MMYPISRSSIRLVLTTVMIIAGLISTGGATTIIHDSVHVRYPTGTPLMMHPDASILLEGTLACSDTALFLTSPLGREVVSAICRETGCRDGLCLEITPVETLLERRRYELQYCRGQTVTEHEIFTKKRTNLPPEVEPQSLRMEYSPPKPENICLEKARFIIDPSGVEGYPSLIMLQRSPDEDEDWITLKAKLILPEASHIEQVFSFLQCEPPSLLTDTRFAWEPFPTGRSMVRITVRDVFSRVYSSDPILVDIPPVGTTDDSEEQTGLSDLTPRSSGTSPAAGLVR